MEKFEILSQATAVCVRIPDTDDFRFLTSAHVAQPWRWPQYYPHDWIQFIHDEHTQYSLDIRADDGRVVKSYQLDRSTISPHPSRDVASLSLEAEAEVAYLSQAEEFRVLPVHLSDTPLGLGTAVTVAGHAIFDDDSDDGKEEGFLDDFLNDSDSESSSGSGLRLQLPEASEGCSLVGRVGAQSFLRTPHVLVEGLCGGGVFGEEESRRETNVTTHLQAATPGTLFGVVDGVVPMGAEKVPLLSGCASFIEAGTLREWLTAQPPRETWV